MRARPWEEVAVKDLEPVREEAMMLAMAECSDSTLINLASISPSAQNRDNSSTIVVWGVMGYAEMTSTRESITP
jgi:hypothetical protein